MQVFRFTPRSVLPRFTLMAIKSLAINFVAQYCSKSLNSKDWFADTLAPGKFADIVLCDKAIYGRWHRNNLVTSSLLIPPESHIWKC